MSRTVFDVIMSAVVVVVLLVAGGLLTRGHSFANSNVHDQLAQQQIFFPPRAAFAHPKAGSEPNNARLATLKQTIFTGTTLRGLLLTAYAFSPIGSVMYWGAIASFILAAVMAGLVGIGLWHARRTAVDTQMLSVTRAAAS